MCNAHNHPIGCKCGWGEGINYSFSRKNYNNYTSFKINYAEKVLEKYNPLKFVITIPNAKCPVCGD